MTGTYMLTPSANTLPSFANPLDKWADFADIESVPKVEIKDEEKVILNLLQHLILADSLVNLIKFSLYYV